MVDHELLVEREAAAEPSSTGLLMDLLANPLLNVLRYADDGPSAGIPRSEHGGCAGWVVAERADFGWAVIEPAGRRCAVGGNFHEVAESDIGATAFRDLSREEAARRRVADAIAARIAAEGVVADVYITERRYLHEVTWGLASDITLCTREEAIAVLGLYFRAQGQFPTALHRSINRGGFYWVGSRELLPESWRWFGACVQNAHDSTESLIPLAQSLLQRVHRALEVRDWVHLALNQPQNNDTQNDALANLDVLLVLLLGALDVAARVAHRVLRLGVGERHVGWQNREWLAQVQKQAPALAALFAPGTSGTASLELLRSLRNSVHGAALQGIALMRGRNVENTVVALPPEDLGVLEAAMERLGGCSAWGARVVPRVHVRVDPGQFADRLVPTIITLLNDVMRDTPVERLAGVALSPTDCAPPREEPFDVWTRLGIRWQLGL